MFCLLLLLEKNGYLVNFDKNSNHFVHDKRWKLEAKIIN